MSKGDRSKFVLEKSLWQKGTQGPEDTSLEVRRPVQKRLGNLNRPWGPKKVKQDRLKVSPEGPQTWGPILCPIG